MSDPAQPVPGGWDCHVHVFDAQAAVRPGHYQPVDRTITDIEALAASHGVGHLVLVQPSVYGSDNSVMLRALQASPGRHRGVAVVDAEVTDAELDHLHAAGVRGVRFNRVSPAGHTGDVEADLRRLAPRLRERGWHLQWYVHAAELPQLVRWQQRGDLTFVLDHVAGLHAALPADDAAWSAAQALAEAGAWIKLSGWYRLGASDPYHALLNTVSRAAAMFGARTVWGSDWPHTAFAHDALPTYASVLNPLTASLGRPAANSVLAAHPSSLYF